MGISSEFGTATRFRLVLSSLCLLLCLPATACKDAATDDPVALLRQAATPLDSPADLTPLITAAGQRRLVLLGEATHGTSEFYTWRAEISRRLITEQGYRFIAVEGDWASCYRLDRYVKGQGPAGATARDILRTFTRWPTWMWANEEVADLVEWLRDHNNGRPADEQVGFYGIDVYGQGDSLRKVLAKLQVMAPDLGRQVLQNYACLQHHADDLGRYAQAVARGHPSCEPDLAAAVDLLRQADHLRAADPTAYFNLKQNALVVKHAERHYRAMQQGGPLSWNSRVDHFFRTTERLLDHHGENTRGIVWAHNTHIGDASATAMAARGEYNIGQLAREALGGDAVLAVGFGTNQGTVMAGSSWGATPAVMTVPPGRTGSLEDLMQRTAIPRFLVLWNDDQRFAALGDPIAHRAIGVVYRPEREQQVNYVDSVVTRRYDAFIFLAETGAVRPLH